MSASSDIQAAIVTLLQAPNALRVNVPVLDRITGDQQNDILANANKQGGLCVYVMPVIPQSAESMQGGDVIFFDAAEVRVRIIEQPRINSANATVYDLMDDVINALHWKELGAITAQPLQLARKPVEAVEGIVEESKQMIRLIDVIFIATYGFQGN